MFQATSGASEEKEERRRKKSGGEEKEEEGGGKGEGGERVSPLLDLVVGRRDFGPIIEVYMQVFQRLRGEGLINR